MLRKETAVFIHPSEDLYVDDMDELSLDDALLSIESSFAQWDLTLEDLLNDLELMETEETSLEAYSATFQHGLTMTDYSLEAEVGGMSKFLGRIAQVYSLAFQETWNGLQALFKGLDTKLDKESQRVQKLRAKFDKIKPQLNRDKHVTSYAGLIPWWLTNKGFVTDVFGTLKTDRDLSQYAVVTYPQMVMEQDKTVIDTFGRANGDATTISKQLDRTKHPALLFDKRWISEQRQYMIQTRVDYSKSKIKFSDDPIKRMATMVRVKIDTADAARVSSLIPDVSLSTRELDQLLETSEWYLKLVSQYVASSRDYKSRMTELQNVLKQASEQMRKHNAPSKQYKILLSIHKAHMSCATQTGSEGVRRALRMARGVRYLAARGIKAAK